MRMTELRPGTVVMLPGYAPYPRYGRITKVDETTVMLTDVRCGDPRCAAEHHHGDATWPVEQVLAVQAYQPRAEWEQGRTSSPNAPLSW